MTDTSYTVSAITGHDYGVPPPHQNGFVATRPRQPVPVHDAAQDDDGQISCICGYFDDDGWTVQCDRCNRWQHQSCYYPDYEDISLPEDLQHYCVECSPRPIDAHGARERQRAKREDAASEINGIKRQGPKGHKKKTKEPPAYTNGWPLDKSRHDRNSASPRDQGPPPKRPKTSHRTSDSVASTKGHSRKRTASNMNHRRSLSRSPDVPPYKYSENFLRAHVEDDWVVSDSNLHASTDVRNALSDWLSAPDDEFLAYHGCEKKEVLWRWDGELEAIPNKAQIEILQRHDDAVKEEPGPIPSWKEVHVREPIAEGAYIGELKGYVGFKDDYISDSANRWPHIRHPEPFVFFHPQLPIYIDARSEGTSLRFVRRSCDPNARLSILVTDATDYHFCFMATKQIDPGTEVAVAWDTWDSVPALQQKPNLSGRDLELLSSWVSKVLANCGPCACQLSEHECIMTRFDRRGSESRNEHEPPSTKAVKSKRKKGTANHTSPLNTNLNSRSGSEVRRADLDDERSDSRSPSASAGRDSASRDITPNTHYSHAGSMSAIPEMSERERKKLAKEEEMFKKQAVEQSGKQGKKKRNSGGSSLSTPSGSTSKQLAGTSSRYTDASTSRQTGLPPTKDGRRSKSNAQKSTGPAIPRSMKRPKPEYVDSSVQCDMDDEEGLQLAPPTIPYRPFLSTTQRLLQRCALNNARRHGPAALAEAQKLIKRDERMEVEPSPSPEIFAKALSAMNDTVSQAVGLKMETADDTEMKDARPDDRSSDTVHGGAIVQDDNETSPQIPPTTHQSTSDGLDLSAALRDPPPSHTETHPLTQPPDLHVQMPPPPLNPFAAALVQSPVSSNGTPGGVMTQSPLHLANPLLSPAVNAAIGPSPAKKKLSLSDYTRRNKAKDHRDVSGEMKSERESSPASVTSASNAAPAFSVAGGEGAKDGSGDAPAPEDDVHDVKMEDVGDAVTTAALEPLVAVTSSDATS